MVTKRERMLPFLLKSEGKESEVKPSMLYTLYSIIYALFIYIQLRLPITIPKINQHPCQTPIHKPFPVRGAHLGH